MSLRVLLLSFFTYLPSIKCYDFNASEDFCFDENNENCDANFAAFLYNPRMPHIVCLGALITDYWVVDNCVDEPGFTYENIRFGTSRRYTWGYTDSTIYIYNIARRISHTEYYRLNFRIDGNSNRYVYAANNTVTLHKTETRVVMIPNVIRAIGLYSKTYYPENGDIIIKDKYKVKRIRLPAIARASCDKHFQRYFTKDEKILINRKQICFQTSHITPEMCYHSYGLLLYDGKLAGIMGWSTVCSKSLGVDPWIFTLLIFYRNFIRESTNLEYYIARENLNQTLYYYAYYV